jgi:hypothetical protein
MFGGHTLLLWAGLYGVCPLTLCKLILGIIFVLTQLITMLLPVVDRWWLQYWTSSDPDNPQHSSTYYVLGYAIVSLASDLTDGLDHAGR